MLGHELRNPLAPMLTALELLRVRLGEAGARERDVIHRQVRNLAQLVDDMLDVAQIRKGRMAHRKEVDLRPPDRGAGLRTGRRRCSRSAVIDSRSTSSRPSLVVVGDERRLIQAVTNLLTNAVKYTEPGGSIRVSVAERRRGHRAPACAIRAGGISADFLPRVFDLFVQGERTPDRREGGLGLGLPIVRSIVERHGGTVSAFSGGVGKGTEFVIRLPAAGRQHAAARGRPVRRRRSRASAPKVLIIDDNGDAAESLHALLRDPGFACASALDGPSGLDAVARFAPDAILLDLGLPGLDGYEVARRIRALPRRRKIPRSSRSPGYGRGAGSGTIGAKRASTRTWSSRSTSISSSRSCARWAAWGPRKRPGQNRADHAIQHLCEGPGLRSRLYSQRA